MSFLELKLNINSLFILLVFKFIESIKKFSFSNDVPINEFLFFLQPSLLSYLLLLLLYLVLTH